MTDPLKQAREALEAARDCILIDRTALADCHMDPVTNEVDADGRAGLADYDAVLSKIDAALSAPQGVPQEWVMVPREPTPEMIEAARDVRRQRLLRAAKELKTGRRPDTISMAMAVDEEWAAMLTAAPAAPKPAEAPALPERLMRFLLRDLKTERADLEGFLSLGNEAKRAAEYDDWIAAVESYCQQYAPAAPQE